MKILNGIFAVGAALLCLSSCESMLEEHPKHMPNLDSYLQSVDGFDYILNGIYSTARQEREGLGGDNLPNSLMLCGTDNMYSNRSANNGVTRIMQDWQVYSIPTDKHLSNFFAWYYEMINNCNIILDNADNPGIDWQDEGNKERVIAEARTLRAWCYRHLTWLWGDVPLTLHKSSSVRTDWVRAPRRDVLRQMLNDFKYGAENLPVEPFIEGRVCRGTAMTYLAETYLAYAKTGPGVNDIDREMADSAYFWADACINTPGYALMTERYGVRQDQPGSAFSDMFVEGNSSRSQGNKESLWTMQWEYLANGGQGGSGNGNIMRRVYAPFYDNSDDAFRTYDYYYVYEENGEQKHGNSTLTATHARGGKSIGHHSLTPYALGVYAASSKSTTDMEQFDDRVKPDIMRLYFIMSEEDKYNENVINYGTGEPWKPGDFLWCATYDYRECPGDKSKSLVRDLNLFNTEITSIKYDFKSSDIPEDGMLTQTATWPYSLKYVYLEPDGPSNQRGQFNDQVYLRLADTYLLKAEAEFRLDGDGSRAAETINALRRRAHAKEVTAADFGTSLEDGLNFILDERSRELLMEEERRYTLLRFGGKDFFYPRVKKYNYDLEGCRNFTQRDTLYPIPQDVIDANIDLPMRNNPGW